MFLTIPSSKPRLSIVVITLSTLVGCELNLPYEREIEIDGPVTQTRDSLVYIDKTHDEIVIVTPEEDSVDVERLSVGNESDAIAWAHSTLDGSQLLYLSVPASAKEEDVEEILYRTSSDGQEKAVEYRVQAPYDSVAFSPDYRHAVLYFAHESTTQIHNANQVAIVDLTSDAVRNVTLDGFGGRLSSVHFPSQNIEGVKAPVRIGDQDRDLVVFLAGNEVVMVDMDDETSNQVAVSFDEHGGFRPQQVLLRPSDDLYADPVLFLRSSSGSDIAMFPLIAKTKGGGFTTQTNLLPIGNRATDMTLYNDGEHAYLVSLTRYDLVFSDLQTQASFVVDIEAGQDLNGGGRVILRDHVTDSGSIKQAVIWGQWGHAIHTLDLDGIQSSLGRKPSHLKIQDGLGDTFVWLDNDRAVAGSGNSVLYVIDFLSEQVTPLTTRSEYDLRSSALDGDTLILGTPNQDWISNIDLKALNPESMVLDDNISTFHYMPGIEKVVVTHDDVTGHLTIVDAKNPSRSSSSVIWGFLFEGLYSQGEN